MTATAWVLTRENIWDVSDRIETCKLHHCYDPATGRFELDGLEVWTLGDRSSMLARFGDTIRRDGARWVVADTIRNA